jgi:hypothetical protein
MRAVVRRLLGVVAVAAMVLLAAPAGSASAHPIGASAVYLTVRADRVDVELAIPLDKLNQATGRSLDGSAASIEAARPGLVSWILAGVRVQDAAAQPYRLSVDALEPQQVNGTRAVDVRLTASPPSGRLDGDLQLSYALLLAELPGHKAFVFLVSDLEGGRVGEGGPAPLGSLDATAEQLTIQRGQASAWTGFAAMVGLGARHIAEGTDHLLFLITLLLAAPLVAAGGRWAGRRPVRSALGRTLGIVTAFTTGHTTSLALVSFGLIGFPSRPVEVAVAASILIAALHALRPLAARGEIVVGGLFGLVHGTAFATAILDLGLDTRATVIAVLGFNVGVELAQLLVVTLVLPVLLLMASRDGYRWVRIGLAGFSALASVCWAVAVLTDTATVLQPLFDLIAAQPLVSYLVFVAVALVTWAAARPSLRPGPTPST